MNKKEAPQDSGEKDNAQDKEIQNVNTNLLKVVIFRSISDNLVAQVGDPVICEEKKDDNNNLLVINQKANFKEDFSFSIDRIYEIMNFSLQMQNKTKKEKYIKLSESIKDQEALLRSIDEDVTLNQQYNYRDEELKLRQLKVFRDSLKRETQGNYMRLGKGGIRQYELIAVDGILYPYFFGSKWFRVYPDLTVKKKIFNHENSVFKNETAALFKNALNWITVVTLIIGLLLCVVGGGMLVYDHKYNSELNLKANQGAITCTNALSTITKNYGGIVNDYMQVKQIELEKLKKDENPNNNKVDIGSIIIDPSKITK